MLFELTPKDILIFLCGVVVSIVIAIIVHNLEKNTKRLEYRLSPAELIKETVSSIPGLSMKINDKPISNLISTTVKFYNSGNQLIQSKDFAQLEPLKIQIEGSLFNEPSIEDIKSNNKNLCPKLDFVNRAIVIGFDYLDPGDFFEINILHDGTLSVCGALKGGEVAKYDIGATNFTAITRVIAIGLAVATFFVARFIGNANVQSVIKWLFYIWAVTFGIVGISPASFASFYPSTTRQARRMIEIMYGDNLHEGFKEK